MGKERIEEIMRMGYGSKRCTQASVFEMELAKLVTACTIMPSMNTGVDFYKDDETGLKVRFYTNSVKGRELEPITIDLDRTLQRNLQLTSAVSRIRRGMIESGVLTEQDCLSKNDDIFWTALNDATATAKSVPNGESVIVDAVTDKALQINTLRKMLNAQKGQSVSQHESLLTTILGLMDYYTNSNDPNNSLSRMNVNARTYFNQLDDFECINRAIRDNCAGGKNIYMNDYICARNPLEDRKASYLAGLYQTKFNSPLFHTEDISVADADILNPDITEM